MDNTHSAETFFAGYSLARRLRRLATSEADRAAVSRLESFNGSRADAERCAALLAAAGDHASARALVFAPSEAA
jgi:hypothetical protein